jgi:hypothetical protein
MHYGVGKLPEQKSAGWQFGSKISFSRLPVGGSLDFANILIAAGHWMLEVSETDTPNRT